MLLAAADALGLDLARSWIVGDTATDIAAGAAAGLAGGVHVLTGHGAREREKVLAMPHGCFKQRFARQINSALLPFLKRARQ